MSDYIHVLKTDHEVFDAVARGDKTHEIRRNDRDFKIGDTLILKETRYTGDEMRGPEARPLAYTGREETRVVSHVLEGYGLQPGWCILSFARAQADSQAPVQSDSLESMTRMFNEACSALGLIPEALGLDPDDGGAEPILNAITELRAERDQWVDVNFRDHANSQAPNFCENCAMDLATCDCAVKRPVYVETATDPNCARAQADSQAPVAWRVRGYAQFRKSEPGDWIYHDGADKPHVNYPELCDFEPLYAAPQPTIAPSDRADEQQAYELGYRHGTPEYQSSMGEAAEKYLATFPNAHPLPAQFRWSEVFRVMMNCTTQPTIAPSVALQVWYGSMPESNGKTRWTAILHRGDVTKGITLDRSEYPERVRYEAERMRWMIGEIAQEPDILAYDTDKQSSAVQTECERDAERYRWLREQAWDTSNLFAVAGGKKNVRLGVDCPRLERLDAAIDAEIVSKS